SRKPERSGTKFGVRSGDRGIRPPEPAPAMGFQNLNSSCPLRVASLHPDDHPDRMPSPRVAPPPGPGPARLAAHPPFAPRPKSTAGTVLRRILKSSHSDQLSM